MYVLHNFIAGYLPTLVPVYLMDLVEVSEPFKGREKLGGDILMFVLLVP